MRFRPLTWCLIVVWVLVIGAYALGSQLLEPGPSLTAYGNVLQCLAPLFANAGLLLNAGSSHWRRNAFWMLLALGCTMWMGGQLLWTHYEVVLRQPVPNPFAGDVIFFLHTVPLIAALTLRPHARQTDRSVRFGYLDFILLLLWWVYLYAFVVIPWQYVHPDPQIYGNAFDELYTLENLLFMAGLGVLWFTTRGAWRAVYACLFGAAGLYTLSSQAINVAITLGKYSTGSLWDLPLVASFLGFGTAGVLAFQLDLGQSPGGAPDAATPRALRQSDSLLAARMAMAAVLSLPLMAAWNMSLSAAPPSVRDFRLIVTLVAMVLFTGMVFLRQHLVDLERVRLLAASQDSLNNLKRLQTSFAQSERMASLGQLAAGAAHEINNPLTAILGYIDLLLNDRGTPEKQRSLLSKVQEQARRTKQLVTNLLSFARQVPVAKAFLDIQGVLRGAVQLRTLDLRDKGIRIQLDSETVLPGVRGDPNQLLQVFYNLISNAVDAMEGTRGGILHVRALREKNDVVIEFSDSGPGIKQPDRVFDPFYTTKPMGKGNGLGLAFCYGIIQEHSGRITCFNRSEGGATFRIELPAVMAAMPAPPVTGQPAPAMSAAPGSGVYLPARPGAMGVSPGAPALAPEAATGEIAVATVAAPPENPALILPAPAVPRIPAVPPRDVPAYVESRATAASPAQEPALPPIPPLPTE